MTKPSGIKASQVKETEEELISKAQSAVSQSNWIVGECAAKWTTKYAKGRTDADFATMVGLTPDQVFQRRRVWETFGDVFQDYSNLKWSHFYVALTWDDAPECLQWSEENQSTVAEMKAWRRSLKGEDLTEDVSTDDWGAPMGVNYVPSELTPVREPDGSGSRSGSYSGERSGAEPQEVLSGAARDLDSSSGEGYAPFRKNAGSKPEEGGSTKTLPEKKAVSTDQLVKKMTVTLEKMNKALTPDVMKEMKSLDQKQLKKWASVIAELSKKAARYL